MRLANRLAILSLILFGTQAACDSSTTKAISKGAADGGLREDLPGMTEGSDAGMTGTAAERVEACLAWKVAECQRGIACGQPVHNCLGDTTGCPDALFSPGSNWTAAQVRQCAQAFATLPCEAALQGRLPACAPPGTRTEGQSCVFASQCQSLICGGGDPGSCFTCNPTAKTGDPCYSNSSCPPGEYCSQEQICTSFAALPVGPAEPPAGPTLGMSCKDSLACSGASYCDGSVCQPLPGKSKPCGLDAKTSIPSWCVEGLVCDRFSNTCVPFPVLGEKCVQGPVLGAKTSWICGDGLRCDQMMMAPYECRDYNGISCGNSWECGSQMACACSPDIINVYCRSRDRACRYEKDLMLAGAACNPDRNLCHPAFACTDGQCVPRESQDFFGQLCKKK